MSEDAIVVQGRSIHFEATRVNILEVGYYLDNPRINYIIGGRPLEEVTPALVEDALLTLDSTKDLIHDIEENGGLFDPILVYKGQAIEGNTRLCAYRRLHRKYPHEECWASIDAHVILDEISPREIFAILSEYHIKGKAPWDAYEKAACIRKMIDQGQTIEEVARTVRSTRPKVERILKAYEAMRVNYLPRVASAQPTLEDQDQLRKYSYFEALFTDKDLAQRVESTPAFLDQFAEWVVEGRLRKAQEVRELAAILSNKRARKAFEEMPSDEAIPEARYILHENKPEKADPFYRQVEKFRDTIHMADVSKVKSEVLTKPSMRLTLERCLREFRKFCRAVGVEGSTS